MTTLDKIALNFCGLGPIGRIPVASGTFGSAAAVLLAPWLFLPLSVPLRLALLILLFVFGGLAGTRVEALLDRKDPGHVVIDEVIGQWVTFLPFAALTVPEMAAGFFLFRGFDILKPPPVRASECWLPGGYGIMIDDVLAGLYACACLALWRWAAG